MADLALHSEQAYAIRNWVTLCQQAGIARATRRYLWTGIRDDVLPALRSAHRSGSRTLANDCPEMPVDELAAGGYVQEANRQFFHPLGLALAYEPDSGRVMVLDSRDDPEGVYFAGIDLAPKAALIRAEKAGRSYARQKALGYVIQPLTATD